MAARRRGREPRPMSSRLWYQPVNGGISQTASALNSFTSAATSQSSKADVTFEQFPLLRCRGLNHRFPGRRHLADLRASALQGAIHRRGRGVEQFGDLGGSPVHHLFEDEHGALPRWQVLQCGDQGQPDAFS